VAKLQRRRLAIDILVNNAGVLEHGAFVRLDAQRQQQLIDLNVSGMTATIAGRAAPKWLLRQIAGTIGCNNRAGREQPGRRRRLPARAANGYPGSLAQGGSDARSLVLPCPFRGAAERPAPPACRRA